MLTFFPKWQLWGETRAHSNASETEKRIGICILPEDGQFARKTAAPSAARSLVDLGTACQGFVDALHECFAHVAYPETSLASVADVARVAVTHPRLTSGLPWPARLFLAAGHVTIETALSGAADENGITSWWKLRHHTARWGFCARRRRHELLVIAAALVLGSSGSCRGRGGTTWLPENTEGDEARMNLGSCVIFSCGMSWGSA